MSSFSETACPLWLINGGRIAVAVDFFVVNLLTPKGVELFPIAVHNDKNSHARKIDGT